MDTAKDTTVKTEPLESKKHRGGKPKKPERIVIFLENNDESMELAKELGVEAIPSSRIAVKKTKEEREAEKAKREAQPKGEKTKRVQTKEEKEARAKYAALPEVMERKQQLEKAKRKIRIEHEKDGDNPKPYSFYKEKFYPKRKGEELVSKKKKKQRRIIKEEPQAVPCC